MRASSNDGNVLFNRDEEFRQTVIRQAMLLGFSAEEYTATTTLAGGKKLTLKCWRFWIDGKEYNAYSSLYSAALDFFRMSNIPLNKVGVVRHD